MFRVWGRIWKDHRLQRDAMYEEESDDTRTHKVFRALEQLCYQLDLSVPVWLDTNISQFRRHASTRFTQDNFIELIDFDAFEITLVEED